ncbi:hypothetical protein AB0I81_46490 [Nonomuraea sp. NPDC050404]|uniref:hypothetical protein n=1 Tax=Nonomuraea sp. NPDC050404 TaxID=3155783 RepID=UPI00340FDF25
MTQPPDEYGDLLRRALRTEADAVVPSPEGLEIIRARIERRGVRNLFWWRAGAAAVSAVLVAGAIVMAVPELRSQVIDQAPVAPAGNESSELPSNSSTTRSHQPPSREPEPQPLHSQPVLLPDSPEPSSPRATRKAESTSKPSPSPSPSPTECDSSLSETAEPPADCPSGSPTPTPTPTMEETSAPPSSCPPEECPPSDEVTESPVQAPGPASEVPVPTP